MNSDSNNYPCTPIAAWASNLPDERKPSKEDLRSLRRLVTELFVYRDQARLKELCACKRTIDLAIADVHEELCGPYPGRGHSSNQCEKPAVRRLFEIYTSLAQEIAATEANGDAK